MRWWYKIAAPGVPEALLEAIFEPFFRVEASRLIEPDITASCTSGAINRTGCALGLALAGRQLRAVSGRFAAAKRSCGGLEIIIKLPVQ